MRPQADIGAARADHGEAALGRADLHSRHGLGRPAPLPRPRPAERAPETNLVALQLAYDSFREPASAGLRGRGDGGRHLVYMSREYAVDLHFESGESHSSVLRGELLSRTDGPLPRVPTFLLDGDEIAGYDCTSARGEFRLETDGAADLRLCLLLDAERCIDLPVGPSSVDDTASEA